MAEPKNPNLARNVKGERNPMYGKRQSNKTRTKISMIITEWHKHNPHPRSMLGKHHSEESKIKISLSNKNKKINSDNPMWKGDQVGYNALHDYIKSRLPKPKKCQLCKKSKPYDLANKSGKYLRDLIDWYWLCRRCHMLSDGRMKNLIQFREEEIS